MRTNQSDSEHLGLIEELELSEPDRISKIQLRDSVTVRAPVLIEVGNESSRGRALEPIAAETRDVSRQRVRVVADVPMQVGDVYITKFDLEHLPLPESYVLCVACRLLPGRDYESQFEFFVPVDLSQVSGASE
ncbi:MAG: hypothetical protein ACI89X_004114 [Planctomycetota bacterium]|jgi:hypothetical protein